MSSRWYPRYVLGNPQLRIFLPDFWMILKKCDPPLPPNKVLFKIPVQMTKYDVKNYLEKIYKIPVVDVKTKVVCGDFKRANSRKPYLIKEDDYKEAVVDLPKDVCFEFPNLYSEPTEEGFQTEFKNLTKNLDFMKKRELRRKYAQNRHNVPDWFGL